MLFPAWGISNSAVSADSSRKDQLWHAKVSVFDFGVRTTMGAVVIKITLDSINNAEHRSCRKRKPNQKM
jgi:hypothetical protein